MNRMMGLKSLPHLRDGYPFLPHDSVAWETDEWAVHGPTLLDLEVLQGTPQLSAVKTEGSRLCGGNGPCSPFVAIFPEYGLLILQA